MEYLKKKGMKYWISEGPMQTKFLCLQGYQYSWDDEMRLKLESIYLMLFRLTYTTQFES